VRAIGEPRLRSVALDVVEQNVAAACIDDVMRIATHQPDLSAEDLRLFIVEMVIAHGAPLPVVVDFDPSVP